MIIRKFILGLKIVLRFFNLDLSNHHHKLDVNQYVYDSFNDFNIFFRNLPCINNSINRKMIKHDKSSILTIQNYFFSWWNLNCKKLIFISLTGVIKKYWFTCVVILFPVYFMLNFLNEKHINVPGEFIVLGNSTPTS